MPRPSTSAVLGRHRPGPPASGRRAVAVLGAAVLAALAACGAPASRYVATPRHDAVLAMPYAWHVASTGVPGENATTGDWYARIDAPGLPSTAKVGTLGLARPIGLVVTYTRTAATTAAWTEDDLRSVFVPVPAAAASSSSSSAQQAALRSSGPAAGVRPATLTATINPTADDVTLLQDRPIAFGTTKGYHLVFSLATTAGVELFDQTAVLSPKTGLVHWVVFHCSAGCYATYRPQIEAAVDSFVVKSR